MYERDFETYMQSFEAFRSRCEEWIDDSDVMTVEVELEGLESDILPEIQNMAKDIQAALKSEILLKPQVKLVKKGSLPMSEGKAVRVKDLRPGRG